MVRCAAMGCSNHTGLGKILHRFPRDPERRRQWEKKVNRRNWRPTDSSYLCTDHFEETQYENRRADNLRRLKAFAVPTIFPSTSTTTKTTSSASKSGWKTQNRSTAKRNLDDNKTTAHDSSPAPPPCVFTEHSYSNTDNEGRLEGIQEGAFRSSECVAGNRFKIDKVSKPDFTNGNSFPPSGPVPDASFSFSSSSFGCVSSPAFSSSFCSGKDEEVIVKKEEDFDIDSVDSVSAASPSYSYYNSEKEVKKEEEMDVVSENALQDFICGSDNCKSPVSKMPQHYVSNDEPLFTFVGISPGEEGRPPTIEQPPDPNGDAGRETNPLLGDDDNLERKKITEKTRSLSTNDAKEALTFVLPDFALASCSGQDKIKIKRRMKEMGPNMDSDGEGAEAGVTAHVDGQFETGNHFEIDGNLQDPKSEVASSTNSAASPSSFPCPHGNRLAKMEQKMKQLEKSQTKQRRRLHKIEKQRKRQSRVLGKIFTKDQLSSLSRRCRRGVKWSKETIRKALLLLSACRPSGYKALLAQKLPLPSLGLLKRLRKP
ncbi:uncharacterized protein LOC127004117 [Eriocheir sinensis]|uniref:uncharacterized protein LOC127004117 n=1 Tax=Eriocheir sinensis TaxID=95602 RepID=UPI0021C57196|nr:uncharacterized protein LOC127004117 [Eriocheir sinensis]